MSEEPSEFSQPSRRASTLILVLATVACFGVVCTYGFTNAEDVALITSNKNFNPPTLRGLWNHWREPHLFLYIPVTYTAWWVLALIGGRTATPDENGATLVPWVFHSFNLLLHLTSAWLVLCILRRLTKREGPALVGAMLFALHPIQAEAVSWTTGTKDTLCGVLSFAAVLFYLRAVTRDGDTGVSPVLGGEGETEVLDSQRREHGRHARVTGKVLYFAGTVFFVFAMLAKPAAVVVPVMAAVIDWLIVGRPWRKVIVSVAPWLVLTIPILVIAKVVQPAADVTPAPLWARPLVAADATVFYLSKIVVPVGLTIDYARTPGAILKSGAAYWTWVVPVVVVIVLWRLKNRWLVAAALLLVAGVLPVLGLTTFLFQRYSTVADRFLYLSMLGPAVAVAWAMSRRWNRRSVTIAMMLLVLLGAKSTAQALTWRNRMTLYTQAVRVHPDNPVARYNLGGALQREGRYEEAGEQFARAVELAPDWIEARMSYSLELRDQGRREEFIEQLRRIIELKKALPEGKRRAYRGELETLAEALRAVGRTEEAERVGAEVRTLPFP